MHPAHSSYTVAAMKKRKVFVLLELWTDEPLARLKALVAHQMSLPGSELNREVTVLQVQANVSQDPPKEEDG